MCDRLDVASASIGVWEREEGLLRTLVNAGALSASERARPVDEVYPIDAFPALAAVLRHSVPYCFGPGDVVDVSSASLAASLEKESQAGAPIRCGGKVWGELWVATRAGQRPLRAADLPDVTAAADEIGRMLEASER